MSAVVAVVFAMFVSNLSSDKIAHVHIYATTILCVIFWIKSNSKMSKFLTILCVILCVILWWHICARVKFYHYSD